MSKKLNKQLIDAFIYITILTVGFCIGKLVNVWYFTLDDKVDIVDLLSIAVTIGAAFFVTKILDKEKEDTRTEKDLILKRVEDIYQFIENSQPKLTNQEVSYRLAASQVKSIYTYLDTASKIIAKTKIQLTEDHKLKIVKNLRQIRDLLTNGNSVNNGIIQLSENRILEIESEFIKLKDNVLIFQIDINKG